MTFIFVPQLKAKQVNAVLRKHGYKLPKNCDPLRYIAAWYHGVYYGYGRRDTWTPLTRFGGIATRPWHGTTVVFPKRIDAQLLTLLKRERAIQRERARMRAKLLKVSQ